MTARLLSTVLGLFLLGASALQVQSQTPPARYVYVWAGTGTHHKPGKNMIAVIDANPASAKYGTVINVLTVDSLGGMPHHSELELPKSGPLFVNDFGMDKSYLIDFSNAPNPRVAGKMATVPGARSAHSFAKLPNGNTIATIQFGDSAVAGKPGGLAEFDNTGKLVRYTTSADPAFPGARIRTYAPTILPAIDRIVTTSSPMDTERTANVVQVWRMSDLKLLKTLEVPQGAADSAGLFPFELKTLADGRTVMMHTYYCGFYTITGLDGEPTIERVMAMEHPKNIGCSVPLIVGKHMIVPIAYAHRYATLDISNPSRPVEVASFQTDSTFYPHWIAKDPGSDRVIVSDQGDGVPMVRMARFDSATGKLVWDEKFVLSLADVRWPNGLTGKVNPHGVLFVP
jgi:hypothetical protein